MAPNKLIGLAVQRLLAFVPVYGLLVIMIISMFNARCLESQGIDIGSFRSKHRHAITIIIFACMIPFLIARSFFIEIYYAYDHNWFVSVMGLLSMYVCILLAGMLIIELQKRWGVGERGADGIVIPGLLDGTLEVTIYGTRLATDKTDKQDRVYSLSYQSMILLLPFANSIIITATTFINTRNLDKMATEAGTKPIRGSVNIVIRTVVPGIVLVGYMLLLVNENLLYRSPWTILFGLYLCTLSIGIALISYQKKIGIGC